MKPLARRRRVAPFLGVALSTLGLLAALPSRAADPVVVVIVDGPGGDALADQITKDKLAGVAAVVRKPKSIPCKLVMVKGPTAKAKTSLDTCVRKAVDADAVVLVWVSKWPKGRVIDVRIVPHDGNATEQHVTLGPKAGPSDGTMVRDLIEPNLAAYAPTPTATATSVATDSSAAPSSSGSTVDVAEYETETPKQPENPKSEEAGPHPNSPQVAVAIGPGLGARSFSYKGASGPSLRPYSLGSALLFGVDAEGYPGDDGTGVRFRPGLAFTYLTTSGLTSETDVGRSIGTTWTRVDIGLRGRLSLGGAKAPVFTLGFGWSREAFVFTEAAGSLPGAVYSTLRMSLGARIPLGPIAVLASFAALPAIRLSGASDVFRERSSLGLEGFIGAALPFAKNFEFRLLASHTRYSTKFVSPPGFPPSATGTTDSYTRLQVLLAFLY